MRRKKVLEYATVQCISDHHRKPTGHAKLNTLQVLYVHEIRVIWKIHGCATGLGTVFKRTLQSQAYETGLAAAVVLFRLDPQQLTASTVGDRVWTTAYSNQWPVHGPNPIAQLEHPCIYDGDLALKPLKAVGDHGLVSRREQGHKRQQGSMVEPAFRLSSKREVLQRIRHRRAWPCVRQAVHWKT